LVNGKPASAICAIDGEDQKEGECLIIPLFVSITDDMITTDHEGKVAREICRHEAEIPTLCPYCPCCPSPPITSSGRNKFIFFFVAVGVYGPKRHLGARGQ
jgi:hypothetical protein